MHQYSLIDLQTFAAVVESGSFNQAAERLNTSSASVSRRVSHLEEALGIRLLRRTTRQLHLTDAGQQYYDDVQNVLNALQEADEKLSDDKTEIKGNLRIAAPMSFGTQVIASLLPTFIKQHRNLHIDLQLEDQQTDLYANGIDLALRIGKLNDSSLIATKLCDIEFGFYASPDYVKTHGEPKTPKDLSKHHCLHYSLISYVEEWRLQDLPTNINSRFSANNGEALREAATQGLGIAALPRFIVAEALAKNQLKAILPNHAPEPVGLYALRLSRRFIPAKVRLMIDYLRDQLQQSNTTIE